MNNEEPLQWVELKQKLRSLPHEELVELTGGLFHLSPDNRLFLVARYPEKADTKTALALYREKVEGSFFILDDPFDFGEGEVDLPRGQKAINDYYQATHDPAGKLALMLAFLDTAVNYASRIGYIEDSFYTGLFDVLDDFVNFMREHSHLYPEMAAQVRAVIEETKKSVLEQVAWTLVQLELDMNQDDADLEGDLV